MVPPTPPSTPSADGTAMMTEEQADQQFQGEIRAAIRSCPGQVIMVGATGFAAGGVVGFMTSGMRFDAPILTGTPASMGGQPGGNLRPLLGIPINEQLKHFLGDLTNGSWKTAKNFASISALFAGGKCAMEGFRSKEDSYNSGIAGCATGSWVTRAAGPKGCIVGCAGFAAFSTVMDLYLDKGSR